MTTGRIVVVNDRMQRGYRYLLTEPVGRNFDPRFAPELTPKEMLKLGVFCGKYLIDTRGEFPEEWFTDAKLAPSKRDCSLNFFGLDASQPLSVWQEKGSRRSARLVSMVLPVLYGSPEQRRRPAPDQALESDPSPYSPNRDQLRERRSRMPPSSTPGPVALGLRQPTGLTAELRGSRPGRIRTCDYTVMSGVF